MDREERRFPGWEAPLFLLGQKQLQGVLQPQVLWKVGGRVRGRSGRQGMVVPSLEGSQRATYTSTSTARLTVKQPSSLQPVVHSRRTPG